MAARPLVSLKSPSTELPRTPAGVARRADGNINLTQALSSIHDAMPISWAAIIDVYYSPDVQLGRNG